MTTRILPPAGQDLLDTLAEAVRELRWHMSDREVTAAVLEVLRDTVRPNPPVPVYDGTSYYHLER